MANFDNIKLEKGLYRTGKSFTQALEEIDPSEQYEGTALEGLDAYERQLKRFDIHVNGINSDVVEKFFKTSDSSALFPEYISRAVKQGLEEANILPRLVATTTKIEGMDYRTIASIPSDDDKELKRVEEGAFIPQTVVKTQENLVKLHKRGRMLVASYEAIRFQRLDLFTVMLKQIGSYIARSELKDAINVIINGDGNNNAATGSNVANSGTLAYSDLIDYDMTTMIAPSAMVAEMLSLSQFCDATAGLNFHGTGKMITPLGAELIRCDDVTASKIIGLDKNYALEKVQAGDIITDYDKLIDRQLERASITTITGFAKIFKDASKILTV